MSRRGALIQVGCRSCERVIGDGVFVCARLSSRPRNASVGSDVVLRVLLAATTPSARPTFGSRVSMRPSRRANAGGKVFCAELCGLSRGRAWPGVWFAPCRAWAVATSLQPGGLWTNQSRSPAPASARHVCPRGCAPSLRAQTRPPESKATCLVAHPRVPVQLFRLLA